MKILSLTAFPLDLEDPFYRTTISHSSFVVALNDFYWSQDQQ
jgi:hypothetical protein